MAEVTKITYAEYLQVIGLLTLAQKHSGIVQDCEKSIMEIIEPQGLPDHYGHTTDAIYSSYTAEDLLGRLEIKVEKRPKK